MIDYKCVNPIFHWLSGKLWYLQHSCVGDTIVYHWDSNLCDLPDYMELYLSDFQYIDDM